MAILGNPCLNGSLRAQRTESDGPSPKFVGILSKPLRLSVTLSFPSCKMGMVTPTSYVKWSERDRQKHCGHEIDAYYYNHPIKHMI